MLVFVLNAFWRRGDVDMETFSSRASARICAQRLLATGRCGPMLVAALTRTGGCAQRLLATGRCGQFPFSANSPAVEVLNAFWRRGDVDLEL